MLFVLGLYLPGAQLEHDAAPSVLNVPVGQLKHAALDALPVLGLNLPAAQLKHAALPALGLYVPAGQRAHDDEDTALAVPAGQMAQEEAPLPLYIPLGHAAQKVEPTELKLPAGHSAQKVDDPVALYVPAAHERHLPKR